MGKLYFLIPYDLGDTVTKYGGTELPAPMLFEDFCTDFLGISGEDYLGKNIYFVDDPLEIIAHNPIHGDYFIGARPVRRPKPTTCPPVPTPIP
jgi:hypothetical protein